MPTNYLTPLYGWNEKAGRYYNLTTGNFVPFMDVRNALESNISVSQANMRALTEQLISVPPTISLDQWQVDMMREIKQANISASAAARGGWAQMTQSDWGAVGQQVRTQYDYLRNFANEIASGKQRRPLAHCRALEIVSVLPIAVARSSTADRTKWREKFNLSHKHWARTRYCRQF